MMATANATNAVEATLREASDKNAARRLRASGMIPAVVYGARKDPRTITVDPKQILKILHSDSGHNTIFDLSVNGDQSKVMVVDWQVDPVKGDLLHADLKRIDMDRKMEVSVPVHVEGESKGVKLSGGLLDVVMREVRIECLPFDIPSHISVDVTELDAGQAIRISDLPQSESVKYLDDEDAVVVHVTHVKEEEEAAPEEGEAAEAEPELIKKGKGEGEEADKEAKKE
jgi:large subunit ribosomal protein L25